MAVESQSQPHDESLRSTEQTPPPKLSDWTRTDEIRNPGWLGDDAVIQLREWASEKLYLLPEGDVRECIIGSEASADLQLCDPRGLVSRRHARLFRSSGGSWKIEDTASKNGIHLWGERLPKFRVVPGVEIRIGSFTLVAETRRLARLRSYLARVLGWEATQLPALDVALRAIRATAARHTPLSLAGADDLVAVARQIHRHTTHADAPFIVCGQRPRETDGSLRVTATYTDPVASFERAAGGTVCVRAEKPPAGFDRLVEAAREPRARAQLMVCAHTAAKHTSALPSLIVVPALAQRTAADRQRIVAEYASDAIHELGAGPDSFTDADRAWVTQREATSFADLEIATVRIVALNHAGNVHKAATRLGLSHVALGDWFRRRGLLRS